MALFAPFIFSLTLFIFSIQIVKFHENPLGLFKRFIFHLKLIWE